MTKELAKNNKKEIDNKQDKKQLTKEIIDYFLDSQEYIKYPLEINNINELQLLISCLNKNEKGFYFRGQADAN